MHWVDLELDRVLPDNEIREAFANALELSLDHVAIVSMTTSDDDPALIPDAKQLAIDRWTQPGEFPLHLLVVVRSEELSDRVRTFDATVKYLLAFCRQAHCDALISCNDDDDETWMLLSQGGTTSTVIVNGNALDKGRFELLPTDVHALTGTIHPN